MTKLTRDLLLPEIGGTLEAEFGYDHGSGRYQREPDFFWRISLRFAGPDARYNPAHGQLGARDLPALREALTAAAQRIHTLRERPITARYEESLPGVGPLRLSIYRAADEFRLSVSMSSRTFILSRSLTVDQVQACLLRLDEVPGLGDALVHELRELVCTARHSVEAPSEAAALSMARDARNLHPDLVYVLGPPCTGSPRILRGMGATREAALAEAAQQVPEGATTLSGPAIVAEPATGEWQAAAASADELAQAVRDQDPARCVLAVTMIDPGRSGWMGLGRRLPTWSARWSSPFVAEVTCTSPVTVVGYWCERPR